MELLSLKFRHRGSLLQWNSFSNLVMTKESGDGGVGKSVTSKKISCFQLNLILPHRISLTLTCLYLILSPWSKTFKWWSEHSHMITSVTVTLTLCTQASSIIFSLNKYYVYFFFNIFPFWCTGWSCLVMAWSHSVKRRELYGKLVSFVRWKWSWMTQRKRKNTFLVLGPSEVTVSFKVPWRQWAGHSKQTFISLFIFWVLSLRQLRLALEKQWTCATFCIHSSNWCNQALCSEHIKRL